MPKRTTANIHPHGIEGQLNIYTLDVQSVVTGFGKHERVVGFEPQFDTDKQCNVRYCRVDNRYNLPQPTDEEIFKVLRSFPINAKGRLSVLSRDPWEDGSAVDIYVKCQ